MPNSADRPAVRRLETLLSILDFSGTYVFAIEGALAAITAQLDIFAALVLAFCTALGGGIIRDVLIGASPPRSIRDWRYSSLAFAGGATAVLLSQVLVRVPPTLLLTFDAAGLALFAIAGTSKALAYDIGPLLAVLMGVITGVGGGTIRDVFLARVPSVLRSDIYATAGLAGAVVFVALIRIRISSRWASVLGGGVCFALRMVAVLRHWNLPTLSVH